MTTRDPIVPAQRPDRPDRDPQRAGRPRSTDDTVTPTANPGESNPSEHEGADDSEVGDRTGPGAGYDDEPEQEPDRGGVA
jgi:hypothetical protein